MQPDKTTVSEQKVLWSLDNFLKVVKIWDNSDFFETLGLFHFDAFQNI